MTVFPQHHRIPHWVWPTGVMFFFFLTSAIRCYELLHYHRRVRDIYLFKCFTRTFRTWGILIGRRPGHISYLSRMPRLANSPWNYDDCVRSVLDISSTALDRDAGYDICWEAEAKGWKYWLYGEMTGCLSKSRAFRQRP
ncbi:uncharacterized protein EV420DRAFT_551088 [Desarmillaria tabescens]|uniref:Uncharacterized protein n=1 Tax=Armillaria tabescens TaxID=1929756 RepID=A0AA39N384_ARMTA|nr:uncharacterized protein EV420DRAFT_1649978 [Desarmillaria tabescens]XP_060329095.1 uncharacterized protein EV420DRAFT_551088 [Desarmillaria tabescens]KAK0441737.1 hypothetical protein EV420DRAFT_1649978 [Desarmillaria tabescens]KAK0455585.1 hypothetical protein EV420DRAFT_551088 [Desarmillaria tabescens]